MRTAAKLITAVLIAIPLVSVAQEEQQLSCVKDITYSKEFLQKYPKAGAACNEVVSVNGQKWARFNAEVKTREGNHLTVSFIDKQEHPVATMTFAFDPNARVTMDNSEQKAASKLEEGDKMVVWVPESRFGFYAEPGASATKHFALVDSSTKER